VAEQRARDPEPVAGRAHMPVQTDDLLEELVDKVLEQDHGTQTDPIDDRPEPPKFKTKPIGVDKATEIGPNDLCDYNLAVEPILEVVVGKCLEQGLMEVLHEEEMKRLKRVKQAYEEERSVEQAEAQRLQQESERKHAEKERRLQQARERVAKEKELAAKLAAQITAKELLASLPNIVEKKLERDGFFADPVLKQVEQEFMPWLVNQVTNELHRVAAARNEVDNLIHSAVRGMMKERDDKIRSDREAAEKKRQEEEAERQRLEAEAKRKAEEKAQREREEEEKRKKEEEEERLREERRERGELSENEDETGASAEEL
jgi:hypothetical protein